ncbi:MAG: hypothetical protein IIB61_04000, partial [Planctomycetes bacterium]|nr:hypothetical protein [Planctomycetota bacterium]
MSLRPLRIATTNQLAHSVRKAGFDAYVLPDPPAPDIQRGMHRRLNDGEIYRPFLEKHDIELVVDFNTGALTFSRSKNNEGQSALTTAQLGIPYVSCLLDPITSVMREMRWDQRWHILENPNWFKGISDQAHGEELARMGIPGLLNLPIAAGDDDFDTRPLPAPDPGPVVSFMGHPATTFFRSNIAKTPDDLYPGILAAAVQADMPDLPFHKIYYDLYRQADPPAATDDPMVRAKKSGEYFDAKFMYNLFLAVKQRDRFACFLKAKLGDNFELIGDFWKRDLGLEHTPRIWDMKVREANLDLPLKRSLFPEGTQAQWEQGGHDGNTYLVCIREHVGRQSILVSILEPISIINHTELIKKLGDTSMITARNLSALPPT